MVIEILSIPLIEKTNNGKKILPWVNRSEDEWRESVSEEEVTRLFYLASLKSEDLGAADLL